MPVCVLETGKVEVSNLSLKYLRRFIVHRQRNDHDPSASWLDDFVLIHGGRRPQVTGGSSLTVSMTQKSQAVPLALVTYEEVGLGEPGAGASLQSGGWGGVVSQEAAWE